MATKVQIAATSDRAHLGDMLDAYLEELSAYAPVRQPYPYFDAYWQQQDGRWPYLIYRDDDVAGFALVAGKAALASDTDFVMAEFYVLPAHRGGGIGADATRQIFAAHSGSWSLHVMQRNIGARAYWPKAIVAAGARDVTDTMLDDTVEYTFAT